MATRDRTAVYKRLRDEYIIHPPSRGGGRFMDGLETKIKEGGKRMRGKKKKGGYDELGGKKSPDAADDELFGSGETVVEMTPTEPAWVSLIEEVREEVAGIEQLMRQLEDSHSDHLLVAFGDDNQKEEEIQILTAEITRKFQGVNKKLKTLGGKGGGGEEQMKRNVKATLAGQLQELSLLFRKKQREYLEKVRGRQESSDDIFPFQPAEQLPEDLIGYDRGFTQDQLEIMTTNHYRQVGRSKEIQEISKSIVELAEIMNDLHTLVLDQGTVLDRIDYNIEQVEYYTSDALEIIEESHENQKQSRTKTCMMGLCVMVMVLCIVLVLKFMIRAA